MTFESQPIPAAFYGDYNHNNVVDAADYTVWRNTLGGSVTAYSGADGNGNGMIDEADYGVWKSHFGQIVPLPGAGSGAAASGEERGASAAPVRAAAVIEDPHPPDNSRPLPEREVLISAHAEPIAQPLRTSGEDERASQGENPPPVLAPRSLLLAPHWQVSRSPLSSGRALAVSRRDEALLTWLALQPNGQPHRNDFEYETIQKDQATDEPAEFRFDAVDEVFGMLAVGV